MKHRGLRAAWGLAVGCLACSGWSFAATVFSNFGPSDSFNTQAGHSISGSKSPLGETITAAMGFTPQGNFTLSQIDVAVAHFSGVDDVVLTLNGDSGGIPGAIMESWTLTGLPNFGGDYSPIALASIPGVMLNAGQTYWLEASAGDPTNLSVWNENSIGETGPMDEYFSGGWHEFANRTQGAFDVIGIAATPEPAPAALTGVGLLCMGGLLRRKPPIVT